MQPMIFNPGDRVRLKDGWYNGLWATIIDNKPVSDRFRFISTDDICYRLDNHDYKQDGMENDYNCHFLKSHHFERDVAEHIPFGKNYDPEQQPYEDTDI